VKKFFAFVFIITIIASAGYFAYSSVKFAPKGQILVAYDNSEKRIIALSGNGWIVAPYAVIPGRVQFYSIEPDGFFEVECSLSLGELDILDDPAYNVSVTLVLNYTVDSKVYVPSSSQLKDPSGAIVGRLQSELKSEFADVINPYLEPPFDSEKLTLNWDDILLAIEKKIRERAIKYGIDVTSLKAQTILQVPSREMYEYGISLRNDLMELRKKHLIERENLNNALNLKSVETGKYYEHLQKISDIIATNPDILKYIYIEKLAPNVKIIAPINSNGYAFGLDNIDESEKDVKKLEKSDKPESKDKDGEVDNLR